MVGFVAAIFLAEVGDGVGRGGRDGPLGCLGCGVGLSVATWGCSRVLMGACNHASYCCSSVRKVPPFLDQRVQSFLSWLRSPHQ